MSESVVTIRIGADGISGMLEVDGQEVGGLVTAILVFDASGQVIGKMGKWPELDLCPTVNSPNKGDVS